MDLFIDSAVTLAVIWIAFKFAWYTIKKVTLNLILGYATYWVLIDIFHTTVNMGVISWVLTALLGPIPVLFMAFFK